MTPTEVLTETRRQLDAHGLKDWIVTVMYQETKNKKVAGLCIWQTKQIVIDGDAADTSVMETIWHEVAHALTPDDNEHGQKWRVKARSLGCSPEYVVREWETCNPSPEQLRQAMFKKNLQDKMLESLSQ
jgi:hypothetical protein